MTTKNRLEIYLRLFINKSKWKETRKIKFLKKKWQKKNSFKSHTQLFNSYIDLIFKQTLNLTTWKLKLKRKSMNPDVRYVEKE